MGRPRGLTASSCRIDLSHSSPSSSLLIGTITPPTSLPFSPSVAPWTNLYRGRMLMSASEAPSCYHQRGGGIISGSIFLNLFLLENYVVWPGQPQCKEGRWCKADSSRGRSLSRTPKPHRRQRRARQTPVISLPTCTICGLKIPNSSTAEKCFSSNGGEKKNILEG